MSKLIIDNREKYIIKYIDDFNSKINEAKNDTNNNTNNYTNNYIKNKSKNKKIIKYEIKQLDIGDILIYVNDKLFIVIERKTINDLISSIMDGRYREQKLRLKALMDKHNRKLKIIYLIEGKLIGKQKSSMPNSTIWSTMCKLIMRDNFIVFRSKSIKESVNFIKTMSNKAVESYKANEYITSLNNQNNIEGSVNNTEDSKNLFSQYASSIRIKKKENLTPGICFSRQLAQIPGVSARIALCIMNIYSSMPKLIIAYEAIGKKDNDENNSDENNNDTNNSEDMDDAMIVRMRKDMLKNIQLTKSRKLGRKLSETIYEYIYC